MPRLKLTKVKFTMKRLLLLLTIFFMLMGCDQFGEGAVVRKKESVDSLFATVKSIPASQPCENLSGYLELEKLEYKNKTSYYSDITTQKITRYSSLCKEKERADQKALEDKIKADKKAKEDRRIAERKVVDDKRIKAAKGSLNILGYKPDVQIEKYDCTNFYFKKDSDDYTCTIRRSATDKIVFFSDPYTKSIGKIFRFVLIDKDQIPDLINKMQSQFGNSSAMGSNASSEDDLYLKTFYGWGNVKLEGFGGLYTLGPKYRTGISLRLSFSACEDELFFDSNCLEYFGIKENPSKAVVAFRLFGDDYELNSTAIRRKLDPREPKTYKSVPTENVDKLTL